MGLDLVTSSWAISDFPPLAVQADEFAGREPAGTGKRRREPSGFAGAFGKAAFHDPDPAGAPASPSAQFGRPRSVLERPAVRMRARMRRRAPEQVGSGP